MSSVLSQDGTRLWVQWAKTVAARDIFSYLLSGAYLDTGVPPRVAKITRRYTPAALHAGMPSARHRGAGKFQKAKWVRGRPMSKELRPGELLVCQIVAAFLFAIVSGFLLIKGVESLYERPQAVRKSAQEETHTANFPNNKPRQPSQSSGLTTPPSAPGALRHDPMALPSGQTRLLADGLKEKGSQLANRLDLRVMETLRDLNTDGVMERAISTENVSPAPEQRTATGKFASTDSSSRGPLPETMKPALVLPAVPFTEEDVRQIQSRLHDLGYLSSPINGRWDARSKTAVQEFKLANRLANDDVLDLATREKLNSPLALRVEQSFLGKWCRPAGPKKLRLTINSRGTNSSTGSKCVFHKIQVENGGWRLRATCSEGSESWNATGKITATGSKLVWVSERDIMKYSRCN